MSTTGIVRKDDIIFQATKDVPAVVAEIRNKAVKIAAVQNLS